MNEKVLLLNRNMVALRLISVRKAFFLITKPRKANPSQTVATPLLVDKDHQIVGPVSWKEWCELEPEEGDRVAGTKNKRIKVPSIVVLAEYDKIPIVQATMNKVNLWKKQRGRDMYTLEKLTWDDCDIDHQIPRSRGGKTDWSNCGLTKCSTNRKKANKTAREAGLTVKIPLGAPPPKPLFAGLTRDPRFPEWDWFLGGVLKE